MEIINRHLADVLLLRPDKKTSEDGWETGWSYQDLAEIGVHNHFLQDNQSHSKRNVLRGLHYQIQHPQGKLIRVTAGVVFDVVVDLRKSSKTYGQSDSFELSAENGCLAWVPPGFAHGFYVTSDYADVLYSVDNYRFEEFERTLLWSDPELNIKWPLLSNGPIISEKDQLGLLFSEADKYT